MRRATLAFALALTACGQPAQAPAPATDSTLTATPAVVANTNAPWFFCDGINEPVIYLFGDSPDDGAVRFIEYDKRTGASVRSLDLAVGEGDAGAGSIYRPLTLDGAEFGAVRMVNAGMFENPASAYTPAYTSLVIEGRSVSCRWLPRTRVAGFTGRRSFVIHEDADGDLIYTTFDFANASTSPIDLTENGRSTAFSVEVRDGQENVTGAGSDFTFLGRAGFGYAIHLNQNGTGTLKVLRNGAEVQSEPMTAFVIGQAEAN